MEASVPLTPSPREECVSSLVDCLRELTKRGRDGVALPV
jgi:hypothetical protein